MSKTPWMGTELVALLISQLPNVEDLNFLASCIWDWSSVQNPNYQTLEASSLSLKSITTDFVHGPIMLSVSSNLQTLNLHKYRPETAAATPPLPALKTLRLTRCNLGQRELEILLDSCTGGLHTVAFESLEDSAVVFSGYDVKWVLSSEVVTHLRKHKKTLRSLYLDFRSRDAKGTFELVQGHQGQNEQPMVDLTDFKALDNILLSTDMIYRPEEEEPYDSMSLVHHLPESITSLSIASHSKTDEMRIRSGLAGLADLKRGQPSRFPDLQLVCSDSANKFDGLGGLFRAVGVDFRQEEWPVRSYLYLHGSIFFSDNQYAHNDYPY
ncbi:hypothetical protein QQX98_001747 [Neonectria punicea]|uniref:F-box domain-containing protein n=1 Tax=Neonectria punicea TaxID=979145 RepID=A0ABR1HN11_9HYPO